MAKIICGPVSFNIESFQERVARAATGFEDLGLHPGQTVALLMRNDVAFLEAVTAVSRVGAYAVPINWHATPEELRHIIRDSDATVALVHADLAPLIAAAGLENMRYLWVKPAAHIADAYRIEAAACEAPPSGHEWESWLAKHSPAIDQPRRPGGALSYSSGTTGVPKGIQRMPHANAEGERSFDRLLREVYGIREGVRTIICGPLYHAMPSSHARTALKAVGRNGVIVVEPRFDPERLLQLIEQHRITQLLMVPVMFVRLLRLPEPVRKRYDLSSLEYVIHAAAPCSYEVKKGMIDWWGPIINEFYGMTETGPVTVVGSEEYLRKPGTVGRPARGCAVKILDDRGCEVPAGTEGEICVSSSASVEFTYRNLPIERAKLDRGGLIATGDIGCLDSEGYLYLRDRKKDMVISGGVNIYPVEIEAVLLGLPQVRDCAVFGIPDDEFGEALAAHIELMPEAGIAEADLRAYLSSRVAKFKVPRVIRFDDALPRDDNGKVYKRRLSEPYWNATGRRI